MNLSPAVLSALSSARPSLGTDFIRAGSNTVRASGPDGQRKLFVKEGKQVAQMEAETKSLEAIAKACPGLAPTVHAFQRNEDGKSAVMVSDYFDLASFSGAVKTDLAHRLAGEMHNPSNAAALSPNGKYGFEVNTFCGATEMDNTWTNSWPTFYRDRRIGDLLKRIGDRDLDKLAAPLKERVIPLLLPEDAEYPPVIIHGDLWSGNVAGRTDKDGTAVVYDPSSFYGHNEAELGIMHMFGGFGPAWFDEYHKIIPRMEPHYDQRIQLYELWHHLNHFLMFGGSYKSGALSIMRELVAYAEKEEARAERGRSKV